MENKLQKDLEEIKETISEYSLGVYFREGLINEGEK